MGWVARKAFPLGWTRLQEDEKMEEYRHGYLHRGLARRPCWAVTLEGFTGLASSSLDGKGWMSQKPKGQETFEGILVLVEENQALESVCRLTPVGEIYQGQYPLQGRLGIWEVPLSVSPLQLTPQVQPHCADLPCCFLICGCLTFIIQRKAESYDSLFLPLLKTLAMYLFICAPGSLCLLGLLRENGILNLNHHFRVEVRPSSIYLVFYPSEVSVMQNHLSVPMAAARRGY